MSDPTCCNDGLSSFGEVAGALDADAKPKNDASGCSPPPRLPDRRFSDAHDDRRLVLVGDVPIQLQMSQPKSAHTLTQD